MGSLFPWMWTVPCNLGRKILCMWFPWKNLVYIYITARVQHPAFPPGSWTSRKYLLPVQFFVIAGKRTPLCPRCLWALSMPCLWPFLTPWSLTSLVHLGSAPGVLEKSSGRVEVGRIGEQKGGRGCPPCVCRWGLTRGPGEGCSPAHTPVAWNWPFLVFYLVPETLS